MLWKCCVDNPHALEDFHLTAAEVRYSPEFGTRLENIIELKHASESLLEHPGEKKRIVKCIDGISRERRA